MPISESWKERELASPQKDGAGEAPKREEVGRIEREEVLSEWPVLA